MRAWVCHKLSADRSGLRFETDWPEPAAPARGEVSVAIRAAALNFPDLLMLEGGYQLRPELPFIPGTEAAGVVTNVGEGVNPAWVGRNVAVAAFGCLAERMTLRADAVTEAPAGYTPAETASYFVGGLTAYVGLAERGRLSPGETVLVLGAGGGMGLAAVSVAKALGAHVIAAASSAEKLDAARSAGADETLVIDRTAPDFAAWKDSSDIVFDPVGGPLLAAAMKTLRWGGRYLLIGFVGGLPLPFATNLALLKGIEIVGVRAGEFSRRDPAAGARARAEVGRLAASGAYRPRIGMTLPLAEAERAFAAMADGSIVGKAVIIGE